MKNQVRQILKWSKILCQINEEILKAPKNNHNVWKAVQLMRTHLVNIGWGYSTSCFAHGVFQVIKEKTLFRKNLLRVWETFFYEIIVTLIHTNWVRNSLLSVICPFVEIQNKHKFFSKLWSGNNKYFSFLLIANRILPQRHTKFNRLLWTFLKWIFLCLIPILFGQSYPWIN